MLCSINSAIYNEYVNKMLPNYRLCEALNRFGIDRICFCGLSCKTFSNCKVRYLGYIDLDVLDR